MLRENGYNPQKAIYLDYNATSPVDREVLAAFEGACLNQWGNPSSLHSAGAAAEDLINKTIDSLQRYFLRNDGQFSFSGSGSLAIKELLEVLLKEDPLLEVITSQIEHSSINEALAALKIPSIEIPIDSTGGLSLNELLEQLKGPHRIVVYSPLNHETGNLQPFVQIYKEAHNARIPVIIDAVQLAARCHPDQWSSFCDGFTFSGHKIYAPKGIAAFFISKEVFTFLQREEESFGCIGTANVPGIAALGKAVDLYDRGFKEEEKRLKVLQLELQTILSNHIQFISNTPKDSPPGILNISLPPLRGKMASLFQFLDKKSIYISRFSACSKTLEGPSSFLLKKTNNINIAETSLRISFGRFTKRADFFMLAQGLKQFTGTNIK